MKALLIMGLLLLVACTQHLETVSVEMDEETSMNTSQETMNDTSEEMREEQEVAVTWKTTPLIDVNTGETYTIKNIEGPVLVESFAVWCPTCTKQQKILKEMKEEGVVFTSVSLNTDPNEDAEKVKTHAERNGFSWRYSVLPAETTQPLVDEFGLKIVSAPSVPLLFVCENGETTLLASGVKDKEEIEAQFAECA